MIHVKYSLCRLSSVPHMHKVWNSHPNTQAAGAASKPPPAAPPHESRDFPTWGSRARKARSAFGLDPKPEFELKDCGLLLSHGVAIGLSGFIPVQESIEMHSRAPRNWTDPVIRYCSIMEKVHKKGTKIDLSPFSGRRIYFLGSTIVVYCPFLSILTVPSLP